jgi:hypothetical protein
MPCIEAIALAATDRFVTPTSLMKRVLTVVDSVTWTAFDGLPEPQEVPDGISRLRHFGATVVRTAPTVGLAFSSPLVQL